MRIIAILGLLISGTVLGTPINIETSTVTQIDRLIAYSKRGNGDIFISTDANIEQCINGYFIDKASAGYEANFSMLLAAYQAKTPVQLSAYIDTFWNGSSGKVCALYNVTYP